MILIPLLTIFLKAENIEIIKSNSYPVSNGFIIPAPGIYLNELASITAINIFLKYEKLKKAVNIGSKLITNLETKIIYKDRYYTNTIKLNDNTFALYENRIKKSRNQMFIVNLFAVGFGILGGILIPNENKTLSSMGLALTGSAAVTIPISYLIVRFKKYKRIVPL